MKALGLKVRPEEVQKLMKEVDVIHEKYRNPCMYYTEKEIWKSLPGLPPPASEPEPECEQ